MRLIALLGLAALGLSACDGGPLQYDATEGDGAIEAAKESATEVAAPAPMACVIGGLNFFEFACPGRPGCNRCRDEEAAGTGYLPNGCIAPSGAACIDFCEYCPAPPAGPSS